MDQYFIFRLDPDPGHLVYVADWIRQKDAADQHISFDANSSHCTMGLMAGLFCLPIRFIRRHGVDDNFGFVTKENFVPVPR